MSHEKYIVVSQNEWVQASKIGGDRAAGLDKQLLMDLDSASKAANGLATRRQMPFMIIKMVPVSVHRATIEVNVETV